MSHMMINSYLTGTSFHNNPSLPLAFVRAWTWSREEINTGQSMRRPPGTAI